MERLRSLSFDSHSTNSLSSINIIRTNNIVNICVQMHQIVATLAEKYLQVCFKILIIITYNESNHSVHSSSNTSHLFNLSIYSSVFLSMLGTTPPLLSLSYKLSRFYRFLPFSPHLQTNLHLLYARSLQHGSFQITHYR